MKKKLYLLLCALLIIGSCSSCTSDNRNDAEEITSNLPTENIFVSAEDEYTTPVHDINSKKEIFLNPAVDMNTRIETFVGAVFYDPKIVFFDNFDNMSNELKNFVFFIGMYRGFIYRNTGEIGHGFTKEMLESNIEAVFGSDIVSKLDYGHEYISSAYDEERGIYIPYVYGAPQYALRYVFHSIENVQGNVYKALVSYINTNGSVLSFAADGGGEQIIPDDINKRIEKAAWENSIAVREEGIEEFKQDILRNPEKYERTELYLEVGDDYINLLSVKLYYETNRDEQQYRNIWADMDFLISTDYPNEYDGAPIAMGSDDCGRDNTGEMSISEMIDSIDNMGYIFLPFTLDAVKRGLYLKFSFNSDLIPAEIKDIYYINGNNASETDRHYLDSLKVPEEIGVYNFFVNLEWADGSEETVYFRAEVVEADSTINEENQNDDVGLDRAFMSEIPMFIKYNWGFDWFKNKTELKPAEVSKMYLIYKTYLFEGNLGHTFELDESGYNWLIPEKAVRETVSYLCDIDPDTMIFNNHDKNNPEYLRFSEAHSPNVSDFDILANTIRFENDIVRFDVNFYDIVGGNERGELLHTIRYEFSRSKYKDLMSCYKFIKATKLT